MPHNNCKFYDSCPFGSKLHLAKNVNIQGDGSEEPEIIFLGMNPGAQEDNENKVFVGPSGKLLRDSLKELDFDLSKVRFTNAVRCLGNGEPPSEVLNICRIYFEEELLRFSKSVKVIVPLGGFAYSALFPRSKDSIMSVAGQLMDYNLSGVTFKVIPNWHPAFLLRQGVHPYQLKKWKDNFLKIKQYLRGGLSLTELPYEILTPDKFFEYANFLLESYHDGKIDSIAYDIESNGVYGEDILPAYAWKYDIIAFSIADSLTRTGYSVGYHHKDLLSITSKEVFEKVRLTIRKILDTIPVIGHNVKYDLVYSLIHFGTNNFKIKDDTYLQAYIFYGKSSGMSLALKPLARMLLGIDDEWEKEVNSIIQSKRLIKDRTLDNVPFEKVAKYNAKDAISTLLLHEVLEKKINSHPKFLPVIDLLRRASEMFTRIEAYGLSVDFDLVNRLNSFYSSYSEEIFYKITDYDVIKKFLASNGNKINLISSEHLRKIFFDSQYMGLPAKGFTNTGKPSASKDVIKQIIEENKDSAYGQLLQLINEYRKINLGYIAKYLNPIKSQTVDGMFKPQYSLGFTETGRLSSFFHTFPKKGEIKRLVKSRWSDMGGVILHGDYSQLELRVLAGVANEPSMIQAFKDGKDIHNEVACAIFNVKPEEVTSDMRKQAKFTDFGIVYGEGVEGLMNRLGCSKAKAQSLFDMMFQRFPKINDYINYCYNFVEKHKYVETYFGRIRILKDIDSKIRGAKNEARRQAQNTPIQGTASDICLDSAVRIDDWYRTNGLNSVVIGSVHDSIQQDVYPSELLTCLKRSKFFAEVQASFRYPFLNGVPLKVDWELGCSWGGGVEFSTDDFVNFKIEGYESDIEDLFKRLSMNYNVTLGSDFVEGEPDDEQEVPLSKNYGHKVKGFMTINWS